MENINDKNESQINKLAEVINQKFNKQEEMILDQNKLINQFILEQKERINTDATVKRQNDM